MNFLARAVSGLENQLDKVLLDSEDGNVSKVHQKDTTSTSSQRRGSRDASPRRSGDAGSKARDNASNSGPSATLRLTMQERLAAAVAKKKVDSTASSSRNASPRSSTDLRRNASPRVSMDVQTDNARENQTPPRVMTEERTVSRKESKAPSLVLDSDDAQYLGETGVTEPATNGANIQADSKEKVLDARNSTEEMVSSQSGYVRESELPQTDSDLRTVIAQLREELLALEKQRKEEAEVSSERIDSLENKLKHLARDSAEAAARRKGEASTPVEKKLAESEERVALLMEEGERLSKKELQHMGLIKRLRIKVQEEEKATASLKKRLEQTERDALDLKSRLKDALATGSAAQDKAKKYDKLAAELRDTKAAKESLQKQLESAKKELKQAHAKVDERQLELERDAVEAEKKVSAELREQLRKLESESADEKRALQSDISDLESKLTRNTEKWATLEKELRSELSVMESKMEVLRTKAEEASSGATGDAQAKLLRQIETLQAQYAVASENWQGIESSLQARLDAIEKERDDLARKEAETRKKAREINQKCKRLELELESSNAKIKDLENDVATQTELMDSMKRSVASLENKLLEANVSHEKEKGALEQEFAAKLEEEKARWEQSLPHSMHNMSPSLRKDSDIPPEILSFQYSRRVSSRAGSVEPPAILTDTTVRRSPEGNPITPSRQGSTMSLTQLLRNPMNSSQVSLSSPAPVDEQFSDTVSQRHTPSARHFSGDLLSVSTVAAGPSVQLMERMSANVRRLESEMASVREELAMISSQRDEARAEIVDLMKEVESKREAAAKCEQLQAELSATLEMLGEKIELVDELTADVGVWKQMYRDLVDKHQ